MSAASDRIDAVDQRAALAGVRFILDELQRLTHLMVQAQCLRAGMCEVDIVHQLGLAPHLEAIDFKAIRDQAQTAYDAIQRVHYAALFPDLWEARQARQAPLKPLRAA